MPKVSVIMGVYNVGDTLAEAMDSLFSQTFNDFEVIICDDGSKDNTIEVVTSYLNKYPKQIILLKNKKNLGLNYTLNRCLDVATGEYIARMDGDDISVPERFEKQVRFLDEHPEYSIVSSPMVLFDEKGDFRTTTAIEFPKKVDCVKSNPFCHAPVMIRAEAYKKIGGYTVNKKMLRVEDVDLWFKLCAAGYRGYNFQEPLYKMRDDRDATSRRKFKYRLNSTYTRLVGCKNVSMPFIYYIYAFKPIIIGLIPRPLYVYLHRKKNSK